MTWFEVHGQGPRFARSAQCACARRRRPSARSARRAQRLTEYGCSWQRSYARIGIGLLLPHHGFGLAAQQTDARPARVGADEGGIAGIVGGIVIAAQEHPFDQLAGEGIADVLLQIVDLAGLAVARERNGIFDTGQVRGRDRQARGRRQGCPCGPRAPRGGRAHGRGARCGGAAAGGRRLGAGSARDLLRRSRTGERDRGLCGREGFGPTLFHSLVGDFFEDLLLELGTDAPRGGGFRPQAQVAGPQNGQHHKGTDSCLMASLSGHSIDDSPGGVRSRPDLDHVFGQIWLMNP